jgi:hypothetical protein
LGGRLLRIDVGLHFRQNRAKTLNPLYVRCFGTKEIIPTIQPLPQPPSLRGFELMTVRGVQQAKQLVEEFAHLRVQVGQFATLADKFFVWMFGGAAVKTRYGLDGVRSGHGSDEQMFGAK